MTRDTVDRTGWPAGEWDTEPDRLEFRHARLPCLLARGRSGAWCGYAAVGPRHPLYGQACDGVEIDVHAGLTYSGACDGHICHVPAP